MANNIFSGLYNYKIKKVAFSIAILAFLLDMTSYFLPREWTGTSFPHVMMHYTVILSLLVITGSRDRIDDELSQRIRSSVFRQSMSVTVVILALLAIFMNVYEVKAIPILVLFYILEGILCLHLVLYQLGKKYSPKWMLNDNEISTDMSKAMSRLLIALGVILVVLYVISILTEISGEV